MSYRIPLLGLRMVREKTIAIERTRITCAADVAAIAGPMIGKLPTERLIAIMLDGTGTVTGVTTLAAGGMHGAGVVPADVLRAVLAAHASAFVLAHNHPSGDSSPSRHDVELTAHVREVARLVGLSLLDHVIVTRGGSFAVVPEGDST